MLNELNEEDQMEINNNIMNATVADLESEGLGDIEFEVRVTDSNNSGVRFTAQEELENLASDGYVQKLGDSNLYAEIEPTGDRTVRRVFAVDGDDIKVVGEYDKENNTVTDYAEENQTKVTVRSIEKDYEKAIEKREEREAANQDGQDYMNSLSSGNSSSEASNAFATVSENNIVQLLDGIYNAESGNECWRTRGFFLRGHRDGSIDFETGKKIMKAVLDKAESLGLEDKRAYKQLKELHTSYSTGALKNEGDFNKVRGWEVVKSWFKGTWLAQGEFFNGKVTNAAIIDECIEALYKDIKKAQEKQGIDENA